MDQEIQVYFMVNPDLVGNGHGLHYGKRNTFYFFYVYFWLQVGLWLIMESEGLLLFSHFSWESTFKILNFFYYFYYFTIFLST